MLAEIEQLAAADSNVFHIKAFDLPEPEKQLVLDSAGIIALGEIMARGYLAAPTGDANAE